MAAALCWLKKWQDLIAGLVGAAALVWTVRWTLLAERRRDKQEARALRTALGAEIRQFGASAVDGFRRIAAILSTGAGLGSVVSVSPQQLGNVARFPDPVVYQHSAARLGTLGDYAHGVVFFFGQVTLVKDALRRLPAAEPVLSRAQLVNFAGGARAAPRDRRHRPASAGCSSPDREVRALGDSAT
jgi:hypothetical protein